MDLGIGDTVEWIPNDYWGGGLAGKQCVIVGRRLGAIHGLDPVQEVWITNLINSERKETVLPIASAHRCVKLISKFQYEAIRVYERLRAEDP